MSTERWLEMSVGKYPRGYYSFTLSPSGLVTWRSATTFIEWRCFSIEKSL